MYVINSNDSTIHRIQIDGRDNTIVAQEKGQNNWKIVNQLDALPMMNFPTDILALSTGSNGLQVYDS